MQEQPLMEKEKVLEHLIALKKRQELMIRELKKDGEDLQQLISNIQPIKKETAEDVLRDMVSHFDPDYYFQDKQAFDLYERAKAVLDA